MVGTNNKQNANRKRRLIIFASAIIALAVLASLAGSCTNRQPEITAHDITININGEACESLDVYAGGETVALTVKLKDKTDGFEAKWIIEGDALESKITSDGIFAPGNTAGNVTLKVEVTQGKTVVTKTLTVTVKPRGLLSIAATFVPKTSYIEGQTFVTDGLVITGTFEAGISEVKGYTLSKTTALVPSDTKIEITYTENGSTAKTNIAIAVAPKTLQGIRIDTQPAQTAYAEGDTFKTAGMNVTAVFEYISMAVTDYTVSKTTPLMATDRAVTITYTENGIIKTAAVEIAVAPKTLQSVTITHAPDTTAYTEGQTFSAAGLVITANYEFLTAVVTNYTTDKASPLMPADTAVTITYTEGGITKTATIDITVAPKTLQSITLQMPPNRVVYTEGELFSSAGMVVKANYEYLTETVTDYAIDITRRLLPMDTEIVIGYTHNGITNTETVTVTVMPKTLQSITVSALPAKIDYIEGQSFAPAGMVVTAIYEFITISVTDYQTAAATVLMIGNEAVTITYADGGITKTATFVLTIRRRTLQSLTVTTEPMDLAYIEGETFSTAGLVLTANYEYLNYPVAGYTVDQTAPLMPSDTAVTFTYTDNGITRMASADITVAVRTLQSIEITTLPGTTAYIEGQKFDKAGMVVTAHYEFKSLIVAGYTVDTATPLGISDTIRTVSYTENGMTKTADVAITMTANLLEYLSIASPASKTAYSAGESLSVVGLVITAHYTIGSQKIAIGWTADKTAPLTTADTSVTITYIDVDGSARVTKSVSYAIMVTDRVLESIAITAEPSKTDYVAGEYFSAAGLTVTAHYSGDQSQEATAYSLSPMNRALEASDAAITVLYTENGIAVAATIDITVAARVLTGIEIVSQPNKTDYKNTELFDASGFVVSAVYNGGSYAKTVTAYTIDKTGVPLAVTDEYIIVSYMENGITQTANVAIVVTPRSLIGIAVTNPAIKLAYTEGEYFDILGLTVTALYSDAPIAIVTSWSHDKPNALSLSDNMVTVTYTESGITKTVSFAIIVTAPKITDGKVLNVIAVIDALPATLDLTLADETAVQYAKELFDALSPEQQAEVTNGAKLMSAVDRIAMLKAMQPPVIEPTYGITYAVYGGLSFADINIGSNPSSHKNSDGAATLNAAYSEIAILTGYFFAGWLDGDTLDRATEIDNLSVNKTYYAVFELTATVNIRFVDYGDKATELYLILNTSRLNEQSSYGYALTSAIETAIYSATRKLAVGYFVLTQSGELVAVTDGQVLTDYGASVTVYVKAVETRTVMLSNELDGAVAWTFNYTDDYGMPRSEHRSFNSGVLFEIPIGSSVMVSAINPLITDILTDGIKANLIYPARDYTFTLAAGSTALEITYEYYVAPNTVITFTGNNTKIYTFNTATWNGKLTAAQLTEIAFIFDEENDAYLNTYVIGGNAGYFAALANYAFSGDTVVTVGRIENRFSLTFVYSGGSFTLSDLKGKQTVGNALMQKQLPSDASSVYSAIFAELGIYADGEHQTAITRSELESRTLLSDIPIYITPREAFTLTVETTAMGSQDIVNVPSFTDNNDYNLRDALRDLTRRGYILAGISETDGGEILSDLYIDTVLQNLNAPVTLYAVWAVDPNYNEPLPPVDYGGENLIGTWTATYNNHYGLISVSLTFESDGTYTYDTYVNGVLSAGLTGEYRFENGAVVIYSLTMQGEYQLIPIATFNIDVRFTADNLLIASMFVVDGLNVTAYDHVLIKDAVRSVNYWQSGILGEYTRLQTETTNGATTEQRTTVTLYENGTATVSIYADASLILSGSGYYRITDGGRVCFMSNGSLGVADFTDVLAMYVKTGQNYASVLAVGTWLAADAESWVFANFIEINVSGLLTAYIGANATGVNLTVVNVSNYTAVIGAQNGIYRLNIELTENNQLRVTMTDMQDGTAQVLTFNRVEA